MDDWPLYSIGKPVEVTTRSVMKAVSQFSSALGGKISSTIVTFEVPVRNMVHLSPDDGSSIAVGSALHFSCGDHRVSKFVYQILLVNNVNTHPTLGGEGEAAACDTDGRGKSAHIPWPSDSKANVSVVAVDATGATVCEARTVVYYGTKGEKYLRLLLKILMKTYCSRSQLTTRIVAEPSGQGSVTCPHAIEQVKRIVQARVLKSQHIQIS